jgi:DNA primase
MGHGSARQRPQLDDSPSRPGRVSALLNMHHYPEGVERPRFWQTACPEHRPDWLPTAPVWSRDKQADIHYCVVTELAALLWAVNLGTCTQLPATARVATVA